MFKLRDKYIGLETLARISVCLFGFFPNIFRGACRPYHYRGYIVNRSSFIFCSLAYSKLSDRDCTLLFHLSWTSAGSGEGGGWSRDSSVGIERCWTHNRKVEGSIPGRSGGRTLFSRVNFLFLLLVRCPFHPRVTAVARKVPWSFCQKSRWWVTSQHTYILDPRKSQWADSTVQA